MMVLARVILLGGVCVLLGVLGLLALCVCWSWFWFGLVPGGDWWRCCDAVTVDTVFLLVFLVVLWLLFFC